eukprot:TRINITY_DN29405_c0_g1_i1.p1 TRINITY_DN29405_c0_g1~~TRINITY_DN29405_c0_g1_i1.p1  ORF type:complete len:129 (-),score=37.33 TRINITY_DN29405_c0_g1_i1:10-396(-)
MCIRDRFEHIMRSNMERRAEVKKNSVAMTIQNERPFSFYERDKLRQRSLEERDNSFEFHAKPVPWFCQVPLFKRMNDQEDASRKERVAKWAQESLIKSRLPPRMEKHCLLYTSPSPRDGLLSRMPSSA